MGDDLHGLTVEDHEVPLATLQRAVSFGALWSVDHLGMLGNYLAIGPNTLCAEEVAEFIDSLKSDGGVGQWDGHGFTNVDDRLIWMNPVAYLKGKADAVLLDESNVLWIPFELDLDGSLALAAFLPGEPPVSGRSSRTKGWSCDAKRTSRSFHFGE